MSTRSRACACIAAFSLLAPSLVAGQERTEREVVDSILRDGPRARAIRAQPEVTRRDQLARLAFPNPDVMFSREGAGFTEFFQVQQALPLFGVRAALSRAGVAATAAAEAERDVRLWLLRVEASETVARLLASQERLDTAESHTREVHRLVEIVRVREREGEGSRFDRLRAEQELRDARHAVTAAAVSTAEASAALIGLLPRDSTLTRISGVLYQPREVPAHETMRARMASTRPELRVLQLSADRAGHESDAARRARLPAPAVFGGLKRADTESGRERGGIFGVTMSLPLFDAGQRVAARWSAERALMESERSAIAQQIHAEVLRSSETLTLRQAAVASDDGAADDELTRIAEVAYREGDVGILELLDAVRTASRARARRIDMRLDARLAQIALERAMGEVMWP